MMGAAAMACNPESNHENQQQSGRVETRQTREVEGIEVPEKLGEVPADSLKSLAMIIHDSVMRKSGKLREMETAIRKTSKKLPYESQTQENFEKAEIALEEADEAMRVWMRQFDPNVKTSSDTARRYYRQQVEQILEVREKTNSSIARAQKVLSLKESTD